MFYKKYIHRSTVARETQEAIIGQLTVNVALLLSSNINLVYTLVTRAKNLRGISILLAFTCHCKLLKNCINKKQKLSNDKK